jgi:hypothetical protein
VSDLQVKTKAPILVTIISWLMLLFGLSNFVGVLMLVYYYFLTVPFGIGDLFTVVISTSSIPMMRGIGIIIVAFGIGRMRKWALYVFTVLAVIGLVVFVYSYYSYYSYIKLDLKNFISPVIEILALIYLWKNYKIFA